MLRIVLWLAVACAVILAALAVSRGVKVRPEPTAAVREAPAALDVAAPAAATPAPEAPPQPVATPEPTPEDVQVQEDAAATGMTTVEPEEDQSAPPSEGAPPQPKR